jgi:hypothetical protein
MPTPTATAEPTPGDPKLMTLSEIRAELKQLDERRRVLKKVERLILELNNED